MTRIAIIGAGISGLATAHYLVRELSAAGRSAEIILFEAEKVPGGKMRTIRDAGKRITQMRQYGHTQSVISARSVP